MTELQDLRGATGLLIVAAADFVADRPLSAHTAIAQAAQRIVI